MGIYGIEHRIMSNLTKAIQSKSSKISIIGLGYVGLPLAVEFSKKEFNVIGIDIDRRRVDSINKGKSYIEDVDSKQVKDLVNKKLLKATSDYKILKQTHIIIICVPTPLRKTRDPDISYILSAVKEIKKYIRQNQLIILESTTYPGTTEEVILRELNSSGLKAGRDFCLAFSPERVDPGNKKYNTSNIPKIVGGISKKCAELTKMLYENIIDKVIIVSSPRTAEMVKLYENVFRNVNIALVNEIMLMCHKMDIDVWEVIEAAKTKPFGFTPFYPGPGIGGHCISTDPTFLSWKARVHGFEARLVELATHINASMPHFVVDKTQDALNDKGKTLKEAKILILGVAYKKDVSDIRESPALQIVQLLNEKGAKISYHDTYVPILKTDSINLKSKKLTKNLLNDTDCVLIVTPHSNIDYKLVVKESNLIIDTRNVIGEESEKVVRL